MLSGTDARSVLLVLAATTTWSLVGACHRADDDMRLAVRPFSRATVAHGLRLGDQLAAKPLDCEDSFPRTAAAARAFQIITFATMDDCSACLAHLAGLEAAGKADTVVSQNQFFVAWAAPAELRQARRAFRSATRRPVCFDVDGSYWSAANLSHTPVTAIIVNGRVLYMTDLPLASASARQQFVDDVERFRSAWREASRADTVVGGRR